MRREEFSENERQRNATYRKLAERFKFWRVCGNRACRRTRGCHADDAVACVHRYWPFLPESVKFYVRAAIKARVAGHSVAEASRIGNEEVARCAAEIARLEAEHREKDAREAQAARTGPQPAPAPLLSSPVTDEAGEPPQRRDDRGQLCSAPRVRSL